MNLQGWLSTWFCSNWQYFSLIFCQGQKVILHNSFATFTTFGQWWPWPPMPTLPIIKNELHLSLVQIGFMQATINYIPVDKGWTCMKSVLYIDQCWSGEPLQGPLVPRRNDRQPTSPSSELCSLHPGQDEPQADGLSLGVWSVGQLECSSNCHYPQSHLHCKDALRIMGGRSQR